VYEIEFEENCLNNKLRLDFLVLLDILFFFIFKVKVLNQHNF